MKKAKDLKKAPVKPARIFSSADELLAAARHLDPSTRQREDIERTLENHLRDVVAYRREMQSIKRSILSLTRTAKEKEEALAALPASMSDDELKNIFTEVAKLPWVLALKITGNYLEVKTRPGTLKTSFVQRKVYDDYTTRYELLEKPLSLPLPQYVIGVNLKKIGVSGAGFSRADSNLYMRLSRKADYGTKVPPETGVITSSPIHWASPGRGAGKEEICLGEYSRDLSAAASKGLIPFLNDLAIFLQTSGDTGAFLTRQDWGEHLGHPEYVKQLFRKLDKTNGETFEQVKKNYRKVASAIMGDAVEVDGASAARQTGAASMEMRGRGRDEGMAFMIPPTFTRMIEPFNTIYSGTDVVLPTTRIN